MNFSGFTLVLAVLIFPVTSFSKGKTEKTVSKPEPSVWQLEPDRVLGVKLGALLSESALPDCPEKSYESTELCLQTFDPYGLGKQYAIGGHPFPYMAANIRINDEGNVRGLVLRLKQSRFNEFVDALKSRYGDPQTIDHSDVQNGAGAVFSSQTVKWIGRKITITAVERFMRADDSVVIVNDNAVAKMESEKAKAKESAAASKL